MFSVFSPSNNPLDHHMIWHHHSILEATSVAFSSNDLHLLHLSFFLSIVVAWAVLLGYLSHSTDATP